MICKEKIIVMLSKDDLSSTTFLGESSSDGDFLGEDKEDEGAERDV